VFDLVDDEIRRIAVRREPVAAAFSADGKFLIVAHHLPSGRSDVSFIAAGVSVVDLAAGKIIKDFLLPNGSTSLKDIRVSPDGKYAVVSHLVGRFAYPTTQISGGWIYRNGLTIIDLSRMELCDSVLLEIPKAGAGNPWGVAWTGDSSTIIVTHAGTCEISVLDFHPLLDQLAQFPGPFDPTAPGASMQSESADFVPFLPGSGQKVKLSKEDLGPRSVVVMGNTAYIANYFSDTLSAIDLAATPLRAESIALGPTREMDAVRKGEFYFHSAAICRQGWLSCSSCHPGDGRTDGLNWDLLNDGRGNPKNTKSLLLAHQTPPSMWLGVRETAKTAVRSGIHNILFTEQPEEVSLSIDEYLKTLKPVPSPHLVHGKLSEAARRGQNIFTRSGCAACHPPGLYTDLNQYDVGTTGPSDKPTDRFDVPTLVEIWRTAPYLHDGSAATTREVLTTRNPQDRHGNTSALSSQEVDDLCIFLLSL
jgi:hypothetical protein